MASAAPESRGFGSTPEKIAHTTPLSAFSFSASAAKCRPQTSTAFCTPYCASTSRSFAILPAPKWISTG